MGKALSLNTTFLRGFAGDEELEAILPEVKNARDMLRKRNGPGGDFLGWMDLPEGIDPCLVEEIRDTAREMDDISDMVVVIGIGGSYLGARAAIEALSPALREKKMFFAGHNLSGEYLNYLIGEMKNREVSVNVISKSGTTTEPAVTFRIIERFMRGKYGPEEIKRRIVCTTDEKKGALRQASEVRGYKSFVIPGDIGGRFSVLTPVGLLPMACAGIDIGELLSGAAGERDRSLACSPEADNSCKYAAVRNILYRKGKKIEVLSSFDDSLHYVAEWWKQLFGESEGKKGRGIFPASCDFTTDLHSLGQLIQEGERNIFETFLVVENEDSGCVIPADEENMDNLDYLAGKDVAYVNRKAYEATEGAHFAGGVPNLTVEIPEISAFYLGQLFYFFEKAVAVSGYIAGVNPFDQPGVESYKSRMFKLLGKPGV